MYLSLAYLVILLAQPLPVAVRHQLFPRIFLELHGWEEIDELSCPRGAQRRQTADIHRVETGTQLSIQQNWSSLYSAGCPP